VRRLAASLLLACAAVPFAAPAAAEDKPASKPEPRLEFLYVETTGVSAEEVPAVAKAVGAVEGVRSFTWTAEGAEAKVVREAGKAPDATLLEKAKAAGAEKAGVVPIAAATLTFEKKLHCGGCVAAVTRALKAVTGVKESVVPQDMRTVVVVYDTRASKPADFEAALAAAGKPAKAPAAR
jgi:copper chaperone CopZ